MGLGGAPSSCYLGIQPWWWLWLRLWLRLCLLLFLPLLLFLFLLLWRCYCSRESCCRLLLLLKSQLWPLGQSLYLLLLLLRKIWL